METSNPFRRQLPPADRGLRSLEKDDPIFTTSSSCAPKIGKGRDEENATVLTGATAGDVPTSMTELPSKSPERVRSKPPPPVVTPRKRASRIEPLEFNTTNPDFGQTTLEDPFSAEEDMSDAIIQDPVSLAPRNGIHSTTPPNPFLRQAKSNAGTRRSLDISELSSGHAAFSVTRSFGTSDGRNRQSLDVDAFKQLMLTGQVPQPPIMAAVDSSSSSNISSGSRRSVSEPILEGANPTEERVHGGIGVDERTKATVESVSTQGSLSRSSSTRIKPPPPKPRSRSGGKSSLSSSTSPAQTTPSSPINNRPPSLQEPDRPHPLSPPPPPPPSISLEGLTEVEKKAAPPPPPVSLEGLVEVAKKVAPPPPLSRGHSVKHHSPLPATEPPESSRGTKSLSPPPPPPIRRTKSTSSRTSPGVSSSVKGLSTSLPPPPPPPHKRPSGEKPADTQLPVLGEEKEETTGNILVDLERLQKEVDELRGKYGAIQAAEAI